MLERAHLFSSISSSVLASALVLAGLAAACTKSESGREGPATQTTGVAASASPSGSAAAASAPEAKAAAAEPKAVPAAAGDADATTKAPSAVSGTKPTASASSGATAASDGAAECGTKPLPDCPLQAWMKANTNPAVAAQDFAALATALDKIVTFAPTGYTNWASIAKDGAKAARAQDMTAAKAACRTCHDQYKDKFKKDKELRSKKI